MFWVGLATLIMLVSGTGDDTYEFRRRVKEMERAVEVTIPDANRQAAARRALDQTSRAFSDHRANFQKVGSCIEKADRKYEATTADYEACAAEIDALWEQATSEFIAAEVAFRKSLQPGELEQIHTRLHGK